MTSENAFQTTLDQHPDDALVRLVFADWLQEHADPRADGYRTLGELAIWPIVSAEAELFGFSWFALASTHPNAHNALPDPWFRAVSGKPDTNNANDLWPMAHSEAQAQYPDRRRLEDAVALAWLAVDAAERMKILARVESPARESSDG